MRTERDVFNEIRNRLTSIDEALRRATPVSTSSGERERQAHQLPPVLFKQDLAHLLRCSMTVINKALREGGNLPPQMPSPDRRVRWSRAAVEAWMGQNAASAAFRAAMRPTFGQQRTR